MILVALLLALQEPPFPNESAVFDLVQDVTCAARRLQPLPRAPSSVYVLPNDDLAKLGMRTLSDALRIVPGLEVSRISATEVNISAQGMNDESSASQGIMGLLDGRQTYNEFLGAVLWEQLPVHLQDIERVEVLRGPASFLYGPNALHGLVNIVTRSPLSYEADRVFLHASGGSYKSNTESLIYARRQGETGLKVKIVRDDIDQFEGRDNTRDKVFLEGRFETRIEEHLFDVTAGIGEQKADVLLAPFGTPPASVAREVFENRIEDGFLKALYTWSGLRAQVSWTRFLSESEIREDVYTPFSLELDMADVDVQYAFAPVSGHTVTAGLGYRRASFETRDEDISLGRHATGLGWVFVQDEVELAGNLWVTGGLRLDDHSVAGASFSPRLAVVWDVAPGQTLRASAGIGYRNPSLRELWLDLPVTVSNPAPPPPTLRVPINGNRDLEPEKMRSMEVAYAGTALGFLRVRATAYYNLLDRLIHFVGLGPENNGKEETMGGEAEADFLLSESFLAFGNATYVVRRDRDSGHSNRGAPRTTGNLGVRYTNSHGWAAILWSTAFERVQFEGPDGHRLPGEAPGYALLNARVSYSFALDGAKGTVFIQGLNILDHDHREHPFGESYGALVTAGIDLSW